MPGIDVEKLSAALRHEVTQATDFDLARLSDVLTALADFVDAAAAVNGGTGAERDDAPLPDEVQRRMLFACAILFDGHALESVVAFVSRNLAPAGLLRLRPRRE